jgi:hypothetical protein
MGLMGSEDPTLHANCWTEDGKVFAKDDAALALSISREELEDVLAGTKTATAPGLDGFPVAFFKKNWAMIKDMVFQILYGFP